MPTHDSATHVTKRQSHGDNRVSPTIYLVNTYTVDNGNGTESTMSIILSRPARAGIKTKDSGRVRIVVVVICAALVAWFVSGLFEPMTDEGRALMLIDGTSGLPQDR